MVKKVNEIPVFEISVSMDINHNQRDALIPMEIDELGEYMLELEIKNEKGLVNLRIIDEIGEEIYNILGKDVTFNGPIDLRDTKYTIISTYLMDIDKVEQYYNQNGLEFTKDLEEDLNLIGNPDEYKQVKMKLIIR